LAQCHFRSDWVGYHAYLRHGTSVCWYFKIRLESGAVTEDLIATVVYSYKLLIKNVQPDHSLTQVGHYNYHVVFLSEKLNTQLQVVVRGRTYARSSLRCN